MSDAKFLFDPKSIREVCVVPNFISEGYFTQTVIPRELELNGATTKRTSGQTWNYCQPVGNHPAMTELLLKRAREVAPGVDSAETSLLIVAHGTDLNENSAVAAKREAEKIRAARKIRGSSERLHGRTAAGIGLAKIDQHSKRSGGAILYLRRAS